MSIFQNSAIVSCDCSRLFTESESENENMIQRSCLSPGISKYWWMFRVEIVEHMLLSFKMYVISVYKVTLCLQQFADVELSCM